MIVQEALFVKLDNFDFDMKQNVTNYHIRMYHGSNILFDQDIEGQLIPEEVKTALEKTQSSDLVIFSEIKFVKTY